MRPWNTMLAAGLVVILAAARPSAASVPGPVAPASGPGAEVGGRPADASETAVARLVQQMAASRYKDRQEAYEKLKAMGPAVIPVLVKHQDSPDPEIRQRLVEILAHLRAQAKGALVFYVTPGSQAERLGFQPGDVLVKINEVPIGGHAEMPSVPNDQERVYHLWREGKVREVKVAPGMVGFTACDWDLTKGGEDQARAMAALARRSYTEAYERLSGAYKAAMEDVYSLESLMGLAEYNLDHTLAMEVYAGMRKELGQDDCTWTHYEINRMGLPANCAHIAWLLERMRTEKPAPPLYHQLDSYLIFAGENLPLARAVMARPWPDAAASDHERYWSAFGRMYLAAYDRRWQEVLNLHAAATRQGLPMDQVEPLVVEAAINVGDVEKACQVARGLLGRYGKEGESGAMGYTTFDYSTALLAVAAAVAAGRDDLARGLLGLAERLDKERFNRLIAQDTHDAWAHLGIVPLVLPFVRSAVTDGEDEFANWVLLRLKTFQRELSLEEWREVFEKHKFGKVNQRYFHWLDAFVLARVGRCAQAKEAARRFADSYSGLEAFHKAMDLVAAHADRLEKDWSELEGTYQLFDGREKGSYWAVRWDGGTLYLDRDGKVRQFPGLAPGQVHVAINGDSIKAFSTGTIYVRGRQVYLFDDQEKRWVPSFASPCRVPAHDDYWDDPTGPLVLKYVMREYPADGPGREMMRRTVGPGAWRLYEFNGDLTLAAHPETLKLVDLSRQIGQRAGKAGPAAVYRLHPQEQAATLLVPTDAGLWRMNQQGELERVDMGLKDPNVIVRLLSWPVRQGKTYVGVAPQQGGQVVEIGDATGQTRLTGGYCGLGPEDSFCWMMHDKRGKRMLACEYAIQRLYEKRLAGQAPAPPGWEPASAPASGAPAPTSGALAGEAPLR